MIKIGVVRTSKWDAYNDVMNWIECRIIQLKLEERKMLLEEKDVR